MSENLSKAITRIEVRDMPARDMAMHVASAALREVQRCRKWMYDNQNYPAWMIHPDKPWDTPLDAKLAELFPEVE